MNDDYLWDKSGEPDPEVRQLEEVLGKLRYQPRPLEIPQEPVVIRRRRYIPYLAIAASLIFALLAGGYWLLRVRDQKPGPTQARSEEPTSSPTNARNRQDDRQMVVEREDAVVAAGPGREKTSTGTRTIKRPNRLTRREREEALIAKQQLLLALRLASEKLNLAQKKTLSPAAPNQIRNQHKVG